MNDSLASRGVFDRASADSCFCCLFQEDPDLVFCSRRRRRYPKTRNQVACAVFVSRLSLLLEIVNIFDLLLRISKEGSKIAVVERGHITL